jgi:hypothetical protein
MAKVRKNIASNKCPVASIMREIEAANAVHEQALVLRSEYVQKHQATLEHASDATDYTEVEVSWDERLEALKNLASFRTAKSVEGAIAQIALASEIICDCYGAEVGEIEKLKKRMHLQRLLYSAVHALEKLHPHRDMTGFRSEFMPESVNPWDYAAMAA